MLSKQQRVAISAAAVVFGLSAIHDLPFAVNGVNQTVAEERGRCFTRYPIDHLSGELPPETEVQKCDGEAMVAGWWQAGHVLLLTLIRGLLWTALAAIFALVIVKTRRWINRGQST